MKSNISKNKFEKNLKSQLKSKVRVTEALVVGVLITGLTTNAYAVAPVAAKTGAAKVATTGVGKTAAAVAGKTAAATTVGATGISTTTVLVGAGVVAAGAGAAIAASGGGGGSSSGSSSDSSTPEVLGGDYYINNALAGTNLKTVTITKNITTTPVNQYDAGIMAKGNINLMYSGYMTVEKFEFNGIMDDPNNYIVAAGIAATNGATVSLDENGIIELNGHISKYFGDEESPDSFGMVAYNSKVSGNVITRAINNGEIITNTVSYGFDLSRGMFSFNESGLGKTEVINNGKITGALNDGTIYVVGKNAYGTNSKTGVIDFGNVNFVGPHATYTGMHAADGGTIYNEGKILNPGAKAGAMYLDEGSSAFNSGEIIGSEDLGNSMSTDTTIGMASRHSGTKSTNNEAGKISGFTTGMSGPGTMTNYGTITVSHIGIDAHDGGIGTNETTGKIYITGDDGSGICARGAGSKVINKGLIDISGATNSYGISVTDGATFENTGSIVIGTEATNNAIYNDGTITHATVYNTGLFDAGTELNITKTGVQFVAGQNGTLRADKVIGTVYADGQSATGIYGTTGTIKNAVVAKEFDGDVISKMVMYNADVEKGSTYGIVGDINGYDISVGLKKYKDVLGNTSTANYLQNNFDIEKGALTSGYDSKDMFYEELNSAETKEELKSIADNATGNSTYPTIQKITNQTLNFMNDSVTKTILSKANEIDKNQLIVDYNYSNSGSKETETTVKYTNYSNVASLGYAMPLGNIKVGVVGMAGKSTNNASDFDVSVKNKNYQANIFVATKWNDIDLVTSPYFGFIDGELHTEDFSGERVKVDADAKYFGITNTAKKKIDLESFYVVPTAEIRTSKTTQSEITGGEYGFSANKTETTSFVPSVGATVGKVFTVQSITITPSVFGMYKYELGAPNKAGEGKYNGMHSSDTLTYDQYISNRSYGTAGARIEFTKNRLGVYADYSYTMNQRSDDGRFTAGLSYKF